MGTIHQTITTAKNLVAMAEAAAIIYDAPIEDADDVAAVLFTVLPLMSPADARRLWMSIASGSTVSALRVLDHVAADPDAANVEADPIALLAATAADGIRQGVDLSAVTLTLADICTAIIDRAA